jgi:protein ImuB
MRIACLQAPELPTDVLAPDEPCAPVAILRGEGTHARVVAVSEAARAVEVRRGMNPAQARAKCAEVRLVRWERRRIVAAERALAAALAAEASPRVARAGAEGSGRGAFWLDASGLGRLGGEGAFAARARAAAVRAGHRHVRIGIAGSAVAAGVAARAAARAPGLVAVPEGGDAAFLAGHPIGWLPVAPEVLQALGALGLARIGEIAALPLDGVGARLGPGGVEAWRLAHGIDARGPLTPPPGREVVEEADLLVDAPAPVAELEPLLFVLRGMLARVEARLESQGLAAASLELVLVREDGEAERRRLRPARATRTAQALWELCRITLEEQGLGGAVAALRLETADVVPAVHEQGDLWQARWKDPAAAEAVLARLRARLGEDAVVRPVAADAHRPEARGRFTAYEVETVAGRGPATATAPAPAPAPGGTVSWTLRLLERPLAIDVSIEDDVPTAVDGHELLEAWGPERLAGEWWTDRPFDRAYWRVATTRQEWLWIFREPAETGAFFLHGWYD